MERIIKICLICSLLALVPSAIADDTSNLSTLITSQNVSYQTCTKVYNVDNLTLFYLTLSAINANRFDIKEIQSKNGYIDFVAVNKEFLATITNVNTNQSMIRVTPSDGNYFFQPGIILNIFKYIELNLNNKIKNYTN